MFLSRRNKDVVLNTHLLKSLITVQGNLQAPDGDFPGEIIAFPYIGNGANGDWTIAHFGDLTRYDA